MSCRSQGTGWEPCPAGLQSPPQSHRQPWPGASGAAGLVKNPPAVQETPVRFLGREVPWSRDRLPAFVFLDFPGGSGSQESACNAGALGLIPGSGRSPGGRPDNQCSCLGNPHGHRSLAGYNPVGHRVLDMTERLSPAQHPLAQAWRRRWPLPTSLPLRPDGSSHLHGHSLGPWALRPEPEEPAGQLGSGPGSSAMAGAGSGALALREPQLRPPPLNRDPDLGGESCPLGSRPFFVRTENNIRYIEIYRNVLTLPWLDFKNKGFDTKKSATINHAPLSPFAFKKAFTKALSTFGALKTWATHFLVWPSINLPLFQTPTF